MACRHIIDHSAEIAFSSTATVIFILQQACCIYMHIYVNISDSKYLQGHLFLVIVCSLALSNVNFFVMHC